jgi:hypothetical protein
MNELPWWKSRTIRRQLLIVAAVVTVGLIGPVRIWTWALDLYLEALRS